VSGNREQGFIRHVALVIDESASIDQLGLTDTVIKVVDAQIADLAERAEGADHENRVTVYTFNAPGYLLAHGHPDGNVRCQFYDRGDLRDLTLKGRYEPAGGTPLIDATLTAIEELALTPQIHGQHRFLVYAVTDGYENMSKRSSRQLAHKINGLEDNWTVAAFVPDLRSVEQAVNFGFPSGNIQRWDATTKRGVEEVGSIMRQTTDQWMISHATGARGSKSLFVGGNVDANAIKAAHLKPLPTGDYAIVPVTRIQGLVQEKPSKRPTKKEPSPPMVSYVEIEPFVSRVHPPFRVGKTYYELVKTERIKGNKRLAVMEAKSDKVFVGDGVRGMLGLPEETKTIKPDFNPAYKIYVESTSLNRHLFIGSSVMVLTK
jgi:hypothetical protein